MISDSGLLFWGQTVYRAAVKYVAVKELKLIRMLKMSLVGNAQNETIAINRPNWSLRVVFPANI